MPATNQVKVITLKQGIEMDELEIVHEMPVTIKGDTIVYNSDSFTTAPNASWKMCSGNCPA